MQRQAGLPLSEGPGRAVDWDAGFTEAVSQRMQVPDRLKVAGAEDPSSSGGPGRKPPGDALPPAFQMHVPDRLLLAEVMGGPSRPLLERQLAGDPPRALAAFGDPPFPSPAARSGPQKRQRPLQVAGERQEPLKSKSKQELTADPKVTRKKKVRGGHKQEALPEKMGAVSLRSPAASPLQRAVPTSESLLEELSRALLRLDMGLEREYAYDILSSLVQKQPCYTFRGSDLPRCVTAKKRALVVDWLVQVHEYLDLDESTLHLAVYLMNAYLRASREQVRGSQLLLLGLSCLFLACKVEESAPPSPAELCDIAKAKFTQEDLLGTERKILSCLKFKLHYANPAPLLRLLAEVGHCTLEAQHLAMYFLELSLLEVECLSFEPAQLALAALCLAQRVLGGAGSGGQEASPRLLTYSEAELATVHPFMARAALRGAGSDLGASFRKYSRPRKLGVSSSPALPASDYLQRCLGSPVL